MWYSGESHLQEDTQVTAAGEHTGNPDTGMQMGRRPLEHLSARGVSGPPLEVLRTWGSSGILGMEPQRSFLLASGDTLHAECNPSSP